VTADAEADALKLPAAEDGNTLAPSAEADSETNHEAVEDRLWLWDSDWVSDTLAVVETCTNGEIGADKVSEYDTTSGVTVHDPVGETLADNDSGSDGKGDSRTASDTDSDTETVSDME
jgi:hypothetical protein